MAKVLRAHPEVQRLRVEGHTDSVGKASHNKTLSARRAEAVRLWLVEEGKIDAGRVESVGNGSTRPIADERRDKEGRARNRRVEFRILE